MKQAVLEDILAHFLPQWRPWYRDRRTWSIVRLGRGMWSRTDYILGTYCRLFRNVAVRYPQNNLDHYMVLGCLCSSPLRERTDYLRRRMRLPLRPTTTLTREDGLFAALRRATPKQKAREARKNAWILADTWRLVDKILTARQGPRKEAKLSSGA